ncbi:MAG: nucleoside 2-deoxyribosyltransferase [Candidatus Aenigmarchaeota archaeon]|nr:nucleoside 2-deoxyribosyltransferase [Candidatus Aenigmarchaeota archaeon]
MKIYFAFTIVGDRAFLEHAKKIVALLESLGHEVLSRHVILENVYQIDRAIPAEEVFSRDIKWVTQCDMLIAEVSNASFGVGYEAAWALSLGKKVLLFYAKSSDRKISLLAKGNTHPNCTVVSYSSMEDIEEFIKKNF